MEENPRIMIGLILLVFTVALFINLPNLIEQTNPTVCVGEAGNCLHEERLGTLAALSPFFVVLGFILGVIVFYFLTQRKKVIEIRPKRETLLMFMDGDERKIVERIAEEGGRVLQSEISRYPGLGKVKAHRVTERLLARGVLRKERHGKTNLVKLTPEIRKLLVD